jgi:hypothetical protein
MVRAPPVPVVPCRLKATSAGNIWTTSGLAAGSDGLLAYIEHIYGTDFAVNAANVAEYAWHSNSSWDPFAAIWNATAPAS